MKQQIHERDVKLSPKRKRKSHSSYTAKRHPTSPRLKSKKGD